MPGLLSCGGVVLLSKCVEILSRFAVIAPLEIRQGTQGSSRVLVLPPCESQLGAQGLLSCARAFGAPLELFSGLISICGRVTPF